MSDELARERGQRTEPLTLGQVHELLSRVLETLHADNLSLQSRIGEHLTDMPRARELIEELQMLDVQSQIILDLAHCLSGLSAEAQKSPGIARYTLGSLFRLDATRLAYKRRETHLDPSDPEKKDENILL